jgi:hypothetical protein
VVEVDRLAFDMVSAFEAGNVMEDIGHIDINALEHHKQVAFP